MAVIALIPTGKLEHAALGAALEKLFPGHTFVTRPSESPLDGFTSRDVAPLVAAQAGPIPTSLEELAAELVNAIFPGRRGERIDFAYVVEDLELFNQHQPQLVLNLFRGAVDSYIKQAWPQQSDSRYAAVRDRCSFHLFRPMTEAYFFGDYNALARAKTVRSAQLPPNLDLEQFRTVDQEFLDLPAGTNRICDMPNREVHPKWYLHYLCDPTLADRSRIYKETKNGADALRLLDWARVLKVSPHCPFLHAFLDDLCEALGTRLKFVKSERADDRVRFPGPGNAILRNM